MNILILSPYPPYPPYGGGTMRIYQIIRGLSARHAVTCLTFAPDAAAEQAMQPLREHCRLLTVRGPEPRSMLRRAWTTLASPLPDMALRNASPAYAAALQALLARESFDIVQAESIEMAGYLTMDNRRWTTVRETFAKNKGQGTKNKVFIHNAKLVLDQFNAEFVLQKRAAQASMRALRSSTRTPQAAARAGAAAVYSLMQWLKLARYEQRAMQACDGVVAVSEDDRRTLQALAPAARIGVVPNGVDTAEFSRAALSGGPLSFRSPALVFTGTLDFRPNIDAALYFAHEVLPRIRAHRPDARFIIVGKRPAPAIQVLSSDGATVVIGEVPDARPYIAGATVYVVPMRIGGGVRLKLLEALALEAPVVSTSMGAEGVLGLQDGEHCLLADQPEHFAAAVLRLLDDRELARWLGAAGRALVQAHYDWTTIVPRLEALYDEIT
jgi:glycosyltransferase involved in cell wall biosynthesis